MEIKAADISDLEKNRMDAVASQSFIAVAVNISEGISSADMYIEHYQKGKLVERWKNPIHYNLFILKASRCVTV